MQRSREAVVRVPLWLLIIVTAVVLMRVVPLPFQHIFIVLFTAILLACAVSPAATRLHRWGIPRTLSILFIYLLVVAIIAGTVALLVPLIVSEINHVQDKLPEYSDRINNILKHFTAPGKQPLSTDQIFSSLSGNLSDSALYLGGLALTIAGILVQLLVVLVTAYFMAVDPEFSQHLVARFFAPAQRPRVLSILHKIGVRLGHWVRAQIVLALFFGISFGACLAVMGVPYALTLGITGAVLEIIPYVGGMITVILATLVAITAEPWQIAGVIVAYTVVTNLEAHVVEPAVMGRMLGIHPMTVVIALFIGAETLGILGALLSVPLAVVLQIALDEMWASHSAEPVEETAPITVPVEASPPAAVRP